MSELPSKEGFIDPNARLLASVIPPPPPSFWQRVTRALREGRIDLRSVASWSRSREGRSCFLVALAAAALAVVLYRSEPTSFARTASAISRETRSESALVAKRESVRPAPRPLADVSTARAAPKLADSADLARAADGERAAPAERSSERSPSASAASAKPKREAQVRRGSARGERHASAAKKSRKKIEKRKAKRKSVARASARSRRAKSKPTKASTPLRAWIASRSRDESNTKQR